MQAFLFKKFFSINIISYIWKLKQNITLTFACFIVALGMKYLLTGGGLSAVYLILTLTMPVIWLLLVATFKHPIYFEVKIMLITFKKYMMYVVKRT